MPVLTSWPARAGVVLTAVAAAGVIAAPAVQAAVPPAGTVAVDGDRIHYVATKSQVHNVALARSGTTAIIDDIVPIKAGRGCRAVAGDRTRVHCALPSERTWVYVDLGDRNDLLVNRSDLWLLARGGAGNDKITGANRDDILNGDAGNDVIWGSGGPDYITGGPGNDTIYGGVNFDQIEGGAGNDKIYGNDGPDSLNGGPGDDLEDGGPGDDRLIQGAVVNGADVLAGGAGWDTVLYTGRSAAVTADPDGVRGDDGAAGERDTVGADVESLVGGRGNDRLTGTARNEHLLGGPGDDVLTGGGGDDRLEGQPGKDRMSGGPGNDRMVGDEPFSSEFRQFDADVFLGGPGRDTADYFAYGGPLVIDLDGAGGDDGVAGEGDTIATDVEDVLGGLGSDRITGNASANLLDGGYGARDVLIGLGGDDTLRARDADGDDRLECGDGDDSFAANDGDVKVDCERALP